MREIMIFRITLCSLAFALFTGCGSGLNVQKVTGKVTLDGTPISGATVSFSPTDPKGHGATGKTDDNGVYTLTDTRSDAVGSGAEAGTYEVAVLWYKSTGPDLSQMSGEGVSAKLMEDKESRQKASGPAAKLPPAYQNPKTSGLTATVKGGSNTVDLALDSKFKSK
jgi:hypothetical protein